MKSGHATSRMSVIDVCDLHGHQDGGGGCVSYFKTPLEGHVTQSPPIFADRRSRPTHWEDDDQTYRKPRCPVPSAVEADPWNVDASNPIRLRFPTLQTKQECFGEGIQLSSCCRTTSQLPGGVRWTRRQWQPGQQLRPWQLDQLPPRNLLLTWQTSVSSFSPSPKTRNEWTLLSNQ